MFKKRLKITITVSGSIGSLVHVLLLLLLFYRRFVHKCHSTCKIVNVAGLVCGEACSSFSEGTILRTDNLSPQFLSAWGQVYCKLCTSADPHVVLCMRTRSSFLPLLPVWQLLLRGAGIEMADPTIQIFCCHRPTIPVSPNNILMEFHSDLYNCVCVMSSLLGIVGAVQQVWVLFWLCFICGKRHTFHVNILVIYLLILRSYRSYA
jgi:hypothetical protein